MPTAGMPHACANSDQLVKDQTILELFYVDLQYSTLHERVFEGAFAHLLKLETISDFLFYIKFVE